jgi:hypothetical protein
LQSTQPDTDPDVHKAARADHDAVVPG